MLIHKFTKQKIENLKKWQPDLLKNLELGFPKEVIENLSYEELIGRIAGFTIENVLKSGGNPVIFEDNISGQPEEDYEGEF